VPGLRGVPVAAPAHDPGHRLIGDSVLSARSVRLPFVEPLDRAALLGFLGHRAIVGVDEVIGDTYRRAMNLPHGMATVEVRLVQGYALARLELADPADASAAKAALRRLLDLDTDSTVVDAALARDPALRPLIAADPGVRVAGAVDGFEMAVRAIVGQQISVAGARTVLARLVAGALGPSTHMPSTDMGLRPFPTGRQLADAPDDAFGMPAARRTTLRRLAVEIAEGRLRLDPSANSDEVRARLVEIPGIGPWTAQYVALRALRDPDVLLPTDLGVRRGAKALGLPDDPVRLAAHAAQYWAPWRSYATIRLWRAG
jgi:AraC family transcriptional regulator, regulatory protein of adaptative response / DNA-3-methyladenine glycosylase II